VRNKKHLCIALPPEQALIVVPASSTCMELYHPTQRLLDEVRALATASGLFIWKPSEA